MPGPLSLYPEPSAPLQPDVPPDMPSPRPDFAAFYRSTLAPLRRYLSRMLRSRDDAQDVAHDAYARVYSAMDAQQVQQPKAFLFAIARRLALNQARRRQMSPVDAAASAPEHAASHAPSVERIVVAREEWAQLELSIAGLPPGCRTVLLLCTLDRLPHAEIAARLGIAISTVEKQHARALRLLREAAATNRGVATAEPTSPALRQNRQRR
jgi:RNA polymerase sigma factor (sigma-70 family)